MDMFDLLAKSQQAVRDITGIDDPSLQWSPDAERFARMKRISAAALEYQRRVSIALWKLSMKYVPPSPSSGGPDEPPLPVREF